MKILALPKGEMEGNSCQYMLYLEIERSGHVVDDYRVVNPFKSKYDIFHVHWPELFTLGKTFANAFLKVGYFLFILSALKLRGTKVIWTVHDVISHEGSNKYFERFFMKIFIKYVDGIVLPLEATTDYALKYYPALRNKKSCVIPTGHFMDVYPNKISKEVARGKLGISNDFFVYGFIGNIANYKGIAELLDAYSALRNNNSKLLVAGIITDNELKQQLYKYAQGDNRIIFIEGYIPNEEIKKYFNACDLIVLPFRKINNSGSLYMAMGFNKPILVPAFEQFKEVKLKYGNDSVFLYDGIIDAEKLDNAREAISGIKIDNEKSLHVMDYKELSKRTIGFFQSLID